MTKLNNILKAVLFLLLANINLYSCNTAEPIIPIIDGYVEVNAKKSATTFNITWEFKKDFIKSLSAYDKNKNGKFDKDEQEEIKDNFISYVKANDYLTDIIYIEKDQKVNKNKRRKFNVTDSRLIFSDDNIKYCFNCDTDFVLEKDHRLYIRFFDAKLNVNVALKEIHLNNYEGKKVIKPQDIRANIYFYDYVAKNNIETDMEACDIPSHQHGIKLPEKLSYKSSHSH